MEVVKGGGSTMFTCGSVRSVRESVPASFVQCALVNNAAFPSMLARGSSASYLSTRSMEVLLRANRLRDRSNGSIRNNEKKKKKKHASSCCRVSMSESRVVNQQNGFTDATSASLQTRDGAGGEDERRNTSDGNPFAGRRSGYGGTGDGDEDGALYLADDEERGVTGRRRAILLTAAMSLGAAGLMSPTDATAAEQVTDDKVKDGAGVGFVDMPALRGKGYGKTSMQYQDYVSTPSGLQYQDLRTGSGPTPQPGQQVVIDWDGFTIGYYGRIFEARNKAKGGSFEGGEKDYFRFKLGIDKVIPAFEEAIATMQVGGIRRLIVPPQIGYPDNSFSSTGPKPTTFSGRRALAFVLDNQGFIDKTLMFDIELLKVVEASD